MSEPKVSWRDGLSFTDLSLPPLIVITAILWFGYWGYRFEDAVAQSDQRDKQRAAEHARRRDKCEAQADHVYLSEGGGVCILGYRP